HAGSIDHVKNIRGQQVETLTLYSPTSRRERIILTAAPSRDDGDSTLRGSDIVSIAVRGNPKDEDYGGFRYSSQDSYLAWGYGQTAKHLELQQPSASIRESIATRLATGTPDRPARHSRAGRALARLHLLSK